MDNTTYLFGAGASCNCLPIYSNFNERFNQFDNFFQNSVFSLKTPDQTKLRKELSNSLKFYIEELKFHSTPDTYAKKLFHTKSKEDLNAFKNILIIFFLYEQLQGSPLLTIKDKQSFDKRYDSFIAALLKPVPGQIEFLEKIKILTWNYDLQFEIAYSQYVDKTIHDIQNDIQGFPKLKSISSTPSKPNDKLTLLHLNGIAYPNFNNVSSFKDKVGNFFTTKDDLENYLLEVYKLMQDPTNNNYALNLSFAWENINDNYKPTNQNLIKAINATGKTETLIINGYSFPIFNRAIDAELIQNMKSLKRIYIQDMYANNVKQILETFFGSSMRNNIVDLGFYNQFYIPEMFKKHKPTLTIAQVAGNFQ